MNVKSNLCWIFGHQAEYGDKFGMSHTNGSQPMGNELKFTECVLMVMVQKCKGLLCSLSSDGSQQGLGYIIFE